MTTLDVTLTPAQWEHYDRHGWTLTEAPGEVWDSFLDGPTFVPVPATVPCPECGGSGYGEMTSIDSADPCPTCSGSGVVPRTVGITRAEGRCECAEHGRWNGERYTGMRVNTRACPWHKTGGVIPAERVGTATVTAVPVVDERGWLHDEDTPAEALVVELDDSLVLVSHRHQHDATALFATPPAPGGTVWRLDKENDR